VDGAARRGRGRRSGGRPGEPVRVGQREGRDLAPVHVGEAVAARERRGLGAGAGERHAVAVGENVRDGAADELGRVRLRRRLGALLREGVDDRLGAGEPGMDADGRDAVGTELVRERDYEPARSRLHDVVRDVAEVVVAHVRAAGEHDQAVAAGDHPGRGGAGRDELRAQAGGEHGVPAVQRLLPERVAEALGAGLVAAPRVRHEQVEAALVAGDRREHRSRLRVVGVVGRRGDAAPAARGDLGGGVVDGPSCARVRARGATGDVDGRPALAEHEREAASDPAACPRHDRDAPPQVGRLPRHRRCATGAARPAPAPTGTPTRPACDAPGGT